MCHPKKKERKNHKFDTDTIIIVNETNIYENHNDKYRYVWDMIISSDIATNSL